MRTTILRLLLFVAVAASVTACSADPKKTAADAIAAGDRRFEAKQYAEAVIEYRRAVQADGLSGEARYKLAKTYVLLGDGPGAYQEGTRAADLLPNDLQAQLQAARILLVVGANEDAKQRALTAIKIDPKSVDAQILLGNALAGLKDMGGALQQMRQALEMDPRNSLTYTNLGILNAAKGDKTAALDAFKRAVAADPKSESAHLALANFYWADKNFADAEEQLKEAVGAGPASLLANRAIATFYLERNQPLDAERYLKAAVQASGDPQAKLTLADFYSSIQRPEEARPLLNELTKASGFYASATTRLAVIDYNAGKKDLALQQLDAVIAKDPKNEDARLAKVRYLFNEQKYAEALALTRAVLTDSPTSAAAYSAEGVLLTTTRDPNGAIEAFETALRLNSTLVAPRLSLARLKLAAGDAKAAADYAGQVIAVQPDMMDAHLVLGRALALQGSPDAALRELTPVARALPQSAEVHSAMGFAYFIKKDLTTARQEYATALKLDPASLEATRGMTTLDLLARKPTDARTRVDDELKRRPNDADSQMYAGQAYLALGDTAAAEGAFRKAVQLDSSRIDAYSSLARIYATGNRLDEALTQFGELARRQPKDAGIRTMTGMIYELKKQPDLAIKEYEAALQIDPRAAVAANNLAQHYADRGENLDTALQLAQTAKMGLPNRPEIDDTLGWVFYKKKQPTLAINAFKRCVDAKPDNPTYLAHLGLAYVQDQNRELARQSLRKALAMRPDFNGAEDARAALKSLGG